MRRDLHNWIAPSQNIPMTLITSTTPVTGNIIDTQGFNILEFVLNTTTMTSGIITPQIIWGNQSNLSDGVVVDTAHLLGTIAGATFSAVDDNVVKHIGVYLTTFRYVQIALIGSSTPNGTIGVIAVKAAPYLMPTGA